MNRSWRKSSLPSRPERGGPLWTFEEIPAGFEDALEPISILLREEKDAVQACPEWQQAEELKSLERLRDEWDGILHDCRRLVSFERWIAEPGRQFLFDHFCRRAIAEWSSRVSSQIPPQVFRTGTETLERHLNHCSFCRIARRREEGYARKLELGLDQLLRGDEIVEQFTEQILADAFFYAKAPRGAPATLIPGDSAAPTTIKIVDESCRALNREVMAEADLAGGCPESDAEVNVVWEPAAPTADESAEEPSYRLRLAFPNQKHPAAVIALNKHGTCRIPLVVPRDALASGVVFRYCGRQWNPSEPPGLLSLVPGTSDRVVDRSASEGPNVQSPRAHLDRVSSPESTPPPTPVPAAVEAILLKWPN